MVEESGASCAEQCRGRVLRIDRVCDRGALPQRLGKRTWTSLPGVLKEDASACIGLASRLGPGRVKHLEIKHLALQQWLRSKRLSVDKVRTEDQKADVLTKAYTSQVSSKLFPLIGLILSWVQGVKAEDHEEEIDDDGLGFMVVVSLLVVVAS